MRARVPARRRLPARMRCVHRGLQTEEYNVLVWTVTAARTPARPSGDPAPARRRDPAHLRTQEVDGAVQQRPVL